MKKKILTQLVDQFVQKHGRLPQEIIVHPVALTALALKRSISSQWQGIPVRCAEIKPSKKASNVKLGITVYRGALRAFTL